MIRELLKPEQILCGASGDLEGLLHSLLKLGAGIPEAKRTALAADLLQNHGRAPDPAPKGVIIPHMASDDIGEPQLFLALSPSGIANGKETAHLVVLLLSPAREMARHLQHLERLRALFETDVDQLLLLRSPAEVARAVSHREGGAVGPTYINLTQEEVALELKTDPDRGLTPEEARRRLELYGPNRLRRHSRTPWTVRILRNFFSFFAILLWTAGILCFVPGVDMPQLGVAILIVVGVNGLFSYFQESKSDKAVEALQRLLSHRCRVVRGGAVREVDAEELVAGDVILVEEGDTVPADARLVEAFEVEVDNSSLTGESTSAKRYKSDQAILLAGPFIWIEKPNIIFAGSSLVRGQGRAVVFGTGMTTEIGRIAGMTQAIKAEDSPLQKQLRSTVFVISALAFALGTGFLLLGWLIAGLSFVQAFVFCIGLFVANVPEGRLPTVTLALAMGVTRMARRNAIVKNLASVETLGCTTVICTDKTGTLTENLMMVQEIFAGGEKIMVTGSGYAPQGGFHAGDTELRPEDLSHRPALFRLLQCAYFCNSARIEKSGTQTTMVGDPTEGALMALAMKGRIRGAHQNLHVNPFESVRKRMSVVVKRENSPGRIVYVKGAPLETLAVCDRVLENGIVVPMTNEMRENLISVNDDFARRGLRVLALAYREDEEDLRFSYKIEEAETHLVFTGLAALADPVRPGVAESIAACHTAGIRIIMITGDYALTAGSIGRRIGMLVQETDEILTGSAVAEMDDAKLLGVLKSGDHIFARVSPEHKLRIVSLLKSLGEIVAVTGDGVNDAPALKRADIGIAMGLRGNDVAKEAAHMILVDDNFNSIVAAIEEGRAIFDNIRRFMAYVLNSNPQEMYPYILWMLFPGAPLAMTVMGVLAVDVGTDLLPAMGLGIEGARKDVMQRPPRNQKEKLLSLSFILRSYVVQGTILALACYTTYLYMGWVLGAFDQGFSIFAMPGSPPGLDMKLASRDYLMTLTAFFFPTVTTQIVNVLCKRSHKESLFSRNFLPAERRAAMLKAVSEWRPRGYVVRVRLQHEFHRLGDKEAALTLFSLVRQLLQFPWRIFRVAVSRTAKMIEKPILIPLARALSRFLERHAVVHNFISNPLVNAGIAFELLLCWLFFYSPLSEIYFFAPVPWHVYCVALIGPAVLLIFEETKKYFRRRGYALEFLG